MFRVPDKYRDRTHPQLKSTAADGCNGVFVIPHHRIAGYFYTVIASDGMGWDHVSVSVTKGRKQPHRCPTWEEMCYIKSLFWTEDETVVQYHPAKQDYINNHEFVLHLWKPNQRILPIPEKFMVGV